MCDAPREALPEFSEVIDALLEVDPLGMPDAELHELVVGMQKAESHFAAARARLLAHWDARRTWANDGSKSAAARLARDCSLSKRTTRTELKRARNLRAMRPTAAALREGRISMDEADLLASANQREVAHLFQRDEEQLLGHLASLEFSQAERAVKYWLYLAQDEVGKTPASCRLEGRHLTAVRTLYDSVDLKGNLDAVGGTEFLTELARREQQLFEADWAEARAKFGSGATEDQLARTAPQRRADALVEMARRSAAMAPGSRRPQPLITILTGLGMFAHLCELANGTVLTPEEVVPLLSGADIERIVFDAPDRPLTISRQRSFPDALRRAIEVRDRHCQHPSGCDVAADRCQVDHIVPYTQGGLTSLDNGRCYCPHHNRLRNKDLDARPPPSDTG
jgi:5-methylcytosine-specific restriction endonuclease McrA